MPHVPESPSEPRLDTAASPPRPSVLCFDGVTLDLAGHRLLIDGRERACSRKAMQLAVLLCERPGQVWPRGDLLDALWPGGQIVADEALSQLVFRLRAALGRYGDRIVTVRGLGVRLDADPKPLEVPPRPPLPPTPGEFTAAAPHGDAAPVAQPPPDLDAVADAAVRPAGCTPVPTQAAEPTPAEAPSIPVDARAKPRATVPGRNPRRRLVAAVLLLLAVAAAWLSWRPGAEAAIDAGYGLLAGDLQATLEETPRLLAEAFRHDSRGERARAMALMEAVHGSDATTPLPALLLALWSAGGGRVDEAHAWLAAARARLARIHAPYASVLANYVAAEIDGSPGDVVRHAGAALDLRPGAWRFHLARAHLYNLMGLREQALIEVQRIPVTDLDHNRQAMALADRASFGDAAGARRLLDSLPPPADAIDAAFVHGRIAWSEGRLEVAREAFLRTHALARQTARMDLRDRALAYVGILDLIAGDRVAAVTAFERARADAVERGQRIMEIDLSLLLAYVRSDLGDAATARDDLQRALVGADANAGGDLAITARLAALRLAPDLVQSPVPDALPAIPRLLLQARTALNAGDGATASARLAQAVAQGALDTRLAEDVRLLQAELGVTVAAGPPLDPPHPPLARFALRERIARLADR